MPSKRANGTLTPTTRSVAIIQREIPHYRIRFFEELYAQGRSEGYEILVYATSHPIQSGNALAFPYRILPVRLFGNSKSSAYWMQGLEATISGTDVVVAPQELQCLTVPYLWAKRKLVCKTWIWWGHGYNHQASVRSSVVTSAKEAVKRFMTRRANGLITYTAGGAEYWRQQGMPEDRVIPYYNTIDVEGLRKIRAEITEEQLAGIRQTLAVEGKRVLLFSGRLYAEKKVDFLLRAFAILKQTFPRVALLIIGDGEERAELEKLAKHLDLNDVHFLGERVDPRETAAYFLLADLMVIPGLVGLAIVHGFAFGLPVITTEPQCHGPELDYLSDQNGAKTVGDVSKYADVIAGLLSAPLRLEAMKRSASEQGDQLSLSHSVRRFMSGIRSFSSQRP